MEEYLKQIAKELKLIRIEMQEEGKWIRDEELEDLPKPKQTPTEDNRSVADKLNAMFNK